MRTRTRRFLTTLTAAAVVAGSVAGVAAPAAAAAATVTVCASGCDYATIQAAVNAATAGDTVSIGAGLYAERVAVSKGIVLEGAGSNSGADSTIIVGDGTGAGLTLTGSSAAPITVRDLRVTGHSNGIATGGYVTLDGVVSTGNTYYGIALNNGTTSLTITDSAFDANAAGVKISSQASASDITITGSSFDNNTGQGWYSDKHATTGSAITGLSITDSTFNGNGDKGFYTEKLSDAVFTRVEFSGSGNARASQGAGLDLNLKYGDYSDIELVDVTVIDSGTASTPNGSGISIAARNDGSYASNAATLDGVTITGASVRGSVTGITVAFAVTGVDIEESALGGNGTAVRNGTASAIDASRNWWGVEAPDFATVVAGDVTVAPWFADAAMTKVGIAPSADNPVITVPSTGEIVVAIGADVVDPVLDVSALTDADGVVTVPDGLAVTGSTGARLELPAGATLTPSDPAWGNEFIPPVAVSLPELTTPDGLAADVKIAIKVGSDSVSFTLDRAARLLLPGAAGSRAGFQSPGGDFTEITERCVADTQAAGDAATSECFITVGDDLVVWTKHFTTFAAFLPTLAVSGSDLGAVAPVGLALVGGGILVVVLVAARRRLGGA